MKIAALVACVCACSCSATVFYPGDETWHQTGFKQGTSWAASVHNTSNAFLTFGPYTTAGCGEVRREDCFFTASFTLSVDNNDNDDLVLATVDVTDDSTMAQLAVANITRTKFAAPFEPQQFNLSFMAPVDPATKLEFRVFYHCCSYVEHHSTTLTGPLPGGALSGFWGNVSHFEPVAAALFPTNHSGDGSAGANVGFGFVTRPSGEWYLFHREYFFGARPSYCVADYARLVVVKSTDKGKTWGSKTVIASPVPNSATECALVDGAPFFDQALGTWLYLSQCLARDRVWNLCLFTRKAADPLGPFEEAPNNPVVKSGQLWASICGPGKHCPSGTGSEGTPEVVHKDAKGYYYVTFHGWDPTAVKSARGIAKTKDFTTWVTADGGLTLPGDALFSSIDCDPWNIQWAPGGCVGGGEGTMLQSGGFFYHLIEAPDITLGCLTTVGKQNWVLGLLRSPSLAWTSGEWQQFVVEPTVVPFVKSGCYIQYHRLFVDVQTQDVYLEYWADNIMQLFRLVPGGGPLPIVAGPPSP